jgi:hypothetical protein
MMVFMRERAIQLRGSLWDLDGRQRQERGGEGRRGEGKGDKEGYGVGGSGEKSRIILSNLGAGGRINSAESECLARNVFCLILHWLGNQEEREIVAGHSLLVLRGQGWH